MDPGKKLLSPDAQQLEGIFMIEEGALEVCTTGKLEPVARLLKGDFCGEITTLFGGHSTATVQCHLSGYMRHYVNITQLSCAGQQHVCSFQHGTFIIIG